MSEGISILVGGPNAIITYSFFLLHFWIDCLISEQKLTDIMRCTQNAIVQQQHISSEQEVQKKDCIFYDIVFYALSDLHHAVDCQSI